jgi:ADP-heptose:LPS heptosyltransferase
MSLPLVFDTDELTIPHNTPYLYANNQLVEYWRKKLASDHTFKIGICWQADTHDNAREKAVKTDAQKKSIPLALLAQLATIPNVTLYSLQKINGLDQLNHTDAVQVFDNLDEDNGPFMDTAAIMINLDLIITIDTSIAHLAGGLGVPVWVLLFHHADWRWMLDRTDSPWYPTMKLFRQKQPDKWQSIINVLQKTIIIPLQTEN